LSYVNIVFYQYFCYIIHECILAGLYIKFVIKLH